mmetsp:Transcript_31344/g.43483  ORF Transcript_31344/g.43483 Transcript_31344/m.43483 type:complete len:366 (-) Transcript_31344:67-1164(-)
MSCINSTPNMKAAMGATRFSSSPCEPQQFCNGSHSNQKRGSVQQIARSTFRSFRCHASSHSKNVGSYRNLQLQRRDLFRNVLISGLVSSFVNVAGAKETRETLVSEELQLEAIQAYRSRNLAKSEYLFNKIIDIDPENPVWYERRGQVKVDLKDFEGAIEDFNTAQKLSPSNYISLGLLANRGLAYEGLARWDAAIKDYTTSIELGESIGAQEPYILNSRGNCYSSVGDYSSALADFESSAEVFAGLKNISGVIYARANAALMQAQLGDEDEAIRALKTVSRRGPANIDSRAALAAIYWSRGEEDVAEGYWNVACVSINSGQVMENGPILDGCANYRDMDWLRRIRRWPPVMVERMEAFLKLQSS